MDLTLLAGTLSAGALSAGTLFADDYQIIRPLSAGGMGAVYVARQLSTARDRALKVMLRELCGSDEFARRFEQEAKIGALIESEHVIEVVGAGVDRTSGAPWLAMELLDGADLSSFIEHHGPLAPHIVLELYTQLSHAMAAAHDKEIVHRDLKPENIFLARSRRAGGTFTLKVLDFGIAKLLGRAQTARTAAMGTPLWMAPEQAQTGAAIGPPCDVWAMGLIAFTALTGRSFWKSAADPNASSMMMLREVAFEAIPRATVRARELGAPLPPPGFDDWFARCVDRQPSARFQHARELQSGLVRLFDPRSSTLTASPVASAFGSAAGLGPAANPAAQVTAVSMALSPATPSTAPSTSDKQVTNRSSLPRWAAISFALVLTSLIGLGAIWQSARSKPMVVGAASEASAFAERVSRAEPAPSASATVDSLAAITPSQSASSSVVRSLAPAHPPSALRVSESPKASMTRVLHQADGRFRACYAAGVKRNPRLEGTVNLSFVVDSSGSVIAANGSGSMPDKGVIRCAVSVVRTLVFPRPADGVLRGSYPLTFALK
ncbi:MAG: protein kinase [Polyangiaceae bacterium]